MQRPRIARNEQTPEFRFREGCFITEWWNVEADADVSIARARVEPGGITRWHALDGIVERYVILEGSARVELGGVAPETVGPGAVVLIPPGTAQRIANVGDSDLVFLAVCTPRFRPGRYRDLSPG